MTAAKSTSRGRRRMAASSVPRDLAAWFGGQHFDRRPLLFRLPHWWQIAELWRAWSADNPGAPPPAGWEWLADPNDRRQHRPAIMAAGVAEGHRGWGRVGLWRLRGPDRSYHHLSLTRMKKGKRVPKAALTQTR